MVCYTKFQYYIRTVQYRAFHAFTKQDFPSEKGSKAGEKGRQLGRDEYRGAMIKFVLMVNKQGQTRLAQYYDFLSIQERVALEAEIIRKCLGRNENQVRGVGKRMETLSLLFKRVC